MLAAASRSVVRHRSVPGLLSVAAVGGGAVVLGNSISGRDQQQLRCDGAAHDDDSANKLFQNNDRLQTFLFTSSPSSSSALVVPTLEAASRAVRLVSTAVLMAMDYKLADWIPVRDDENGENKMREHWEQETEKRRQKLEETQQFYSRPSHHHLDYAGRIQAKRLEKQAMLEAAEELAEAEDALAKIGSRTSAIHRHAAQRLLELCRRNGGVYIKVGQHLANLDYLLPQEYIATLSSLFDDTPKTSYEQVAAVIQEDLGASPEDLFAGFDTQPMASASLAQVHVAYDKQTGRKLAVKVQHRGLRETSRGDIFALVSVVRLAERLLPDFTYGWLADEIAPHLPKELDFINEGQNAELAAEHLRQQQDVDCIVPRILWDFTTPRVLTMEFEEGFKATDTESIAKAGLQSRDVAQLVSSVFSSQVFAGPKGWVHCDPHPGNLLVRPSRKRKGKPQVILLDHGLYRELDDTFRVHYAHLWKSLMLADLKGIKDACSHLGVGEAYPLFSAVITARPFDELIERSKHGGSLRSKGSRGSRADQVMMRGYAQRYLGQIFALLANLPRQMLLLLKMNDCLRHIDYSLGSPSNTVVVCGRYAARAVLQYKLDDSSSSWIDKLRAWLSYMHVLLRINIHDAGAWWLNQSKTSAGVVGY